MPTPKISLQDRLSKVTNLNPEVKFTQGDKIPDRAIDFHEVYKANSSAKIDSANVFTIDVLPNFVPILCFVIYHANVYSTDINKHGHSKTSVPTFVSYCMSIIYGYFLLSDMYVRPSPSVFASSWKNSTFRDNFATFLASLPVPEFILPILTSFHPFADDTRHNVIFVASAAGYRYEQHFGKIIPTLAFYNIHDVVCEQPSNAQKFDILNALYSKAIYHITAPAFNASLANYIGYGYNNAAARTNDRGHSTGKLFQVFESLFSPVLFRDYHKRHSLASISLEPPTFATSAFNVYDWLFAATRDNLAEQKIVLSSVKSFVLDSVKCSGTLADAFTASTGAQITRHGYSLMSLPTAHGKNLIDANGDIISSAKLSATDRQISRSARDIAIEIGFLPPIDATPSHKQPQPQALDNKDQPIPDSHVSNITWPWNLLHDTLNPPTASKPSDIIQVPSPETEFETFDSDRHHYPPVRVLNFPDDSTVDAHLATLTGMVIESFEIDGSVVAHPDAHLSNGVDNTWFADSAISLRYVYQYNTLQNGNASPIRARSRVFRPTQGAHPIATLFVDRTQINLPRPAPYLYDQLIGNNLPGLTIVQNVTWIAKVKSFLGSNTSHRLRRAENTYPGIDSRDIYVWSPYTYTPVSPRDDAEIDYSEQVTYFLTNLRTIFGTRNRMIEVQNSLEVMPVM
nr:putative coat protein [Rhizoctonia solani virus 717]